MNSLLGEISSKYAASNRIHAVMFEITNRCPCDCIHCLLVKEPEAELSLDEIADLFAQLRGEGTLNITITGGEPFLRDDLPQILELARKDHFFTHMLTTGILIGKPEVKMLKNMGVRNVEISLLGANPDTHDSIMQFPGAFNRTMEAVKLLKENDFMISLKSTVMRPNMRELNDMALLARTLGVHYSASIMVAPRVDGDISPQKLALSEDEIAVLDPALLNGGLIPGEEGMSKLILTCNAGITSAGISPKGDIFPCIILRHNVGNILERTLQDIWHDNPDPMLEEMRQLRPEDVSACYNCELKSYCWRCPGVAYLETGDIRLPNNSSCVLARGMQKACDHTGKTPFSQQ